MTKLAGVSIRKNTEGRITHVTIEVDKHRAVMQPVLKQLGIYEDSEMEHKYGNALLLEESLQSTLGLVDKLFDDVENKKIDKQHGSHNYNSTKQYTFAKHS